MSFYYGQKSIGIFVLFLSCFSCQNLNKVQTTPKTNSLYNHKKVVIDQSLFDILADSSYLKGEEAFYTNQNTLALKHFKTALLWAPNSLHLRKRIASIYEQEKLFAEALFHYKILSQKTKSNTEFKQKLTSIYAQNELNEKALEHLHDFLKQEPKNFLLRLQQAFILVHQEDWTAALKILQTIESQSSNMEETVQSILTQAYIWTRRQNKAKSLQTMNKLNQLSINKAELVLKIADFYKFLGKESVALSWLENFQKTHGVMQPVAQIMLDHYISDKNWEKAIWQIQQLQDMGLLEDHHYFYMAMLMMEKQNYAQSLVFLKDLNVKNPKNGQYLYLLGLAYEQQKAWTKALNTYRQVQESSLHFLVARLQLAQLLEQLGHKKQSFTLLKKLSFPRNQKASPQSVLLYASLLWKSEQKKQALATLNKGLKSRPLQTDLLFLRGFYLKKTGLWELALKDMNQILEAQENHEEALNFIASFYSEQKTQLNKAEKLARKAVSLKPQSSYFTNTLGWILFQKGNLKSALHYLNQAFEQNKTNSLIAKRLGTVYLQLKEFKKSDYFFKESLKLEQNEQVTISHNTPRYSQQTLVQ